MIQKYEDFFKDKEVETKLLDYQARLQIELKKYTNAYVLVDIKEDILSVEFYFSHNLDYIFNEYSITSKIISGLKVEDLAKSIIEKYKRVINIRYFKNSV